MNKTKIQTKTNDFLTIPFEVISKFHLLNKVSIILLLELYKKNQIEPDSYFTSDDFKKFNYVKATYKTFMKECEENQLINVFYHKKITIILINNEIGKKQYEYLIKNKDKELHEFISFTTEIKKRDGAN